jgi:large subunit ribosomal protein L25
MAETYILKAEPREQTGKQVNQLRRDGRVPAVLYGHKVKPQNLTVARGELEKVYRRAGGSSIVNVKLPKGEQNVLIQEVQEDPRTGLFLHADFFQVKMDEKIKAEVPLEFEGEAAAVRELDGILVTNLNELEVECLPGDLPSEIKIDISTLKTFEDDITVADIKAPGGVDILNDPEANVVTVSPPRTQEELEELEETPEEEEEPEVVGEAEAEEAEAEEGAAKEGEAAESEDKAKAETKDEKTAPDQDKAKKE